ncbi:MAG: amidohydrolase family protein [Candidatus Sericytochromatia bacterium]
MDISIKDGTIVTANDIFRADIGIRNGKIAAIGHDIVGMENIDASGKYILPGVVEVHSHFESAFGSTRSIDNFFKGTQAAACGGVTTIIDTVMPKLDESLSDAVKQRKQLLDSQAAVDYALHVCLPDAQASYLEELPQLLNAGIPSFEAFLFGPDAQMVHTDASLLQLMDAIGSAGGMLMVHCGNQALLQSAAQRYPLSEPDAFAHYSELCTTQSEAEGVFRLMTLAQASRCSLYLCQLSCRDALNQALQNHPLQSRIFTGTDLHYLTHTDQAYLGSQPRNYTVLPPLRSQRDLENLWKGIEAGTIHLVSSNHWAFTQEQKKLGEDLASIPTGFANLELLLPVLYHHAVGGKHMDLMQLVALLSTNPARIFGLSRKGSIAVGKDADLVVFNPLMKKTMSSSHLHSESDFCLYEGLELQGYPEMTFSRGQIVCDNGKFTGEQGAGQFLARSI